jgi:hypothetical protein
MNVNDILEYIKKKKDYIQKDYKLYCIFENFFLKENKEYYDKKSSGLEEKLQESVRLITPYKVKNLLSRAVRNPYKDTRQIGKFQISIKFNHIN